MGLIFRDGFDSYAATSDLARNFTNASTPWAYNATAGRNGGGSVQAVTTAAGLLSSKPFSAATVLIGFGFWLKFSAAPASATDFFQLVDVASTSRGALRVNLDGTCSLRDITGGTTRATGTFNFCDNNYHWFEWYVNFSASSLTHKLFIDTFTQWNFTTAGFTSPGAFNNFTLLSILNRTLTYDDIISFDTSAGAPAPADIPLGPREITTLRPTADSAVSFSRSAGSDNFALVDEQSNDGDATYVQGVSGQSDLYDFEDLSFTPAQINTVAAVSVAENPNPGTFSFRQSAKNGATTTDGASTALSPNYQQWLQSFPLDPDTAAAWTASGVNSAKFGPNVP